MTMSLKHAFLVAAGCLTLFMGGCAGRQPDVMNENGDSHADQGEAANGATADGAAPEGGGAGQADGSGPEPNQRPRPDAASEVETLILSNGRTIQAPVPGGLDNVALRVWNDPEFQKRFAESYKAETDIEPRVTEDERETLQKVLKLLGQEEHGEAKELLQEELNEAASAALDFTLGNIHFQLEEWDRAVEMYNSAVEKFPKYRRAWDNMGKIHIRRKQYPEAIAALTKVIELGGGGGTTYGLLGFGYTSVGRHIAAESSYRMAVLLDDETMDWKLGLARSFFKQNRYAEAATLLDRLIQLDPDRADFWLLQANAYIGLGETVKAAENYELLRSLDAVTVASLNTLGDIYVNEELYERAVDVYVEAIEKAGKEAKPDRAVRAARVLAARGALAETERLVKRVEAAFGDQLDEETNTRLLKLRARIAVAQGADERQVEILKRIVDVSPRDGEALMLLGRHFAGKGEIERAILYYERAAKVEGYKADALVRHAQALVRDGEFHNALPLLREAQEIRPRDNVRRYLEQVEQAARSRG